MRMKRAIILLLMQRTWAFLLLPMQETRATNKEDQSPCYMIRRKVILHHEESTLTYISQMWTEVKQQQRDKTVRNSTAEMLLQSLERMTQGWCDPSHTKVSKRSLTAVLAIIFAFGSLILGPAISAVLQEISHNTEWRISQAEKGLETEKILAEFEKRLKANSRVEEILASILLHESIMRDLLSNTDSNRTWKKIFKHQIEEFKKLGLIEQHEDLILGRKENLLPTGTYKLRATVHKNRDCGETKITIKAIGLIPDKKCLQLHKNQDKDFVRLLPSTFEATKNHCIFAGKDSTVLKGNKTFMTSNTIIGPCDNEDNFIFKSKNNTLLVRPKGSRGYMTSTCGKKVIRKILYRDQLYILPLKCTSWVSTKKRKAVNEETDYFQAKETFLSATTGKELEYQGKEPTLIFYAVEAVKDLEQEEDGVSLEHIYMENFLDAFNKKERHKNWDLNEETAKINITSAKILIVLASTLSLIMVIIILRKVKRRAETRSRSTAQYLRGRGENEDTVTVTIKRRGEGAISEDITDGKRDQGRQAWRKSREKYHIQEDEEMKEVTEVEYENMGHVTGQTLLIKRGEALKRAKKDIDRREIESVTDSEYESEESAYETVSLLPATKNPFNKEEIFGPATKNKERGLQGPKESEETYMDGEDDILRRRDKKDDENIRGNREARIYQKMNEEEDKNDTDTDMNTNYETMSFLTPKYLTDVYNDIDKHNKTGKSKSEEPKSYKMEAVKNAEAKIQENETSEKHLSENDTEKVMLSENDTEQAMASEKHLSENDTEKVFKTNDRSDNERNKEPLYDVPRKLQITNTEGQEREGATEEQVFADDPERGPTEEISKKTSANRNNEQRIQESVECRGSLHSRLMKELQDRYHAMKARNTSEQNN